MEEKRQSAASSIVIWTTLAVLFSGLTIYIAGYFVLCEAILTTDHFVNVEPYDSVRMYGSPWIAAAYQPAGYVESLVTWKKVGINKWDEQ